MGNTIPSTQMELHAIPIEVIAVDPSGPLQDSVEDIYHSL